MTAATTANGRRPDERAARSGMKLLADANGGAA